MFAQSFPFPPDRLSDAGYGTFLLHVALLAAALAPLWLLFRRSRRPASRGDCLAFVAGILVFATLLVTTPGLFREELRPFVGGYALFAIFNCVTGLAITLWRLLKGTRGAPVVLVLSALALFGLLIGLCLPSVPAAREAARRMQCSYNLKQLSLGLLQYEATRRHFPATAGGEPPVSWRVALLPLIERESLYDEYDRSQAWDASPNNALMQRGVDFYQCPSVAAGRRTEAPHVGAWLTAYNMVTGPGAALQARLPTRSSELASRQRLAIVESAGLQRIWTEPDDVEISPLSAGVNLSGQRPGYSPAILSSYHTGGAQAALLDGSVQFISEKIDPAVLEALIAGPPVEAR